ncbi:MAG TPA: hypothetical protein VGG37_04930 [Opitutaceae bacterium]|jgi:type II secretory pathway component PulK
MNRRVRSAFLGLAQREMALIAVFAVMVAVVWAWSVAGRTARFGREVRSTTGSLNEQQLWLSNRAAIEQQAQASAGRLDPSRTLDATRLLAEVSAIATESNLPSNSTGAPKDVSSGRFSVHSLEFNVTKVDWNTLKQFYLALSKRSPYIGVEQYSMQADKANPALLNASFQISSVEVGRD